MSVVYGSRVSRAIVMREPFLPAIFSGAFNTFEGGTDTTTITTGNSGGSSGAPFDAVSIASGGAATFDSASSEHGSLGAKLVGAAISGHTYVEWGSATLGTLTDGYGRAYISPQAGVPPNGIVGLLAGVQQWMITFGSSGQHVCLLDSASTIVATSTLNFTNSAYIRVEWHHNSASQLVARIYLTPDATSFDEEITAASGTASNIDTIRFESGQATSKTYLFDDLAAGVTSWPGPSGVQAVTPVHPQLILQQAVQRAGSY